MLMRALLIGYLFLWSSCLPIGAADGGTLDVQESAKATTFEGQPGCAKCDFGKETKAEQCAPVLVVKDARYWLKMADGANESVSKKLAGCPKDLGEKLTVKGVASEDKDGRHWIEVSEIVLPTGDTATEKKNTKAIGEKDDAQKTGMQGIKSRNGFATPRLSYLHPNWNWMDALLQGLPHQSMWEDGLRPADAEPKQGNTEVNGLLGATARPSQQSCLLAPSDGDTSHGKSR
ncbi:MAG: hypothetical protein KIS92_05230 [Planctomycetota bacterium]|nr:hypothetical protein [Planctomycetota bacterium]